MAVTPNFSWPVPVATDFVKDGWEAISDLGNAIDTTVATVGAFNQIGATQSFTTQATVNLNDIFSADYKYYQLVITGITSNDVELRGRLRVAGADNTNNEYGFTRLEVSNSTSSISGNNATSSWNIGTIATQRRGTTVLNIQNPFESLNTSFTSQSAQFNNTSMFVYINGGNMSVTTSYTGFTIFPSTGTFTGTISVYGIKG
jgi:hypothetical protein